MALTKVKSSVIAAGAVTADKIAAGAVTADKVSEGVGGGPKITQVQVTDNAYTVLDDTAVDLSGGYIKLIGTGFVTGCQVIIGTTAATATTFVSSTEVRAQVPAQSAGSYFVYVVNPDGGTATRVNGITYSASPTWTTASALPNATSNVAYTQALEATGATAYSLQAGSSLPAGMTLTSGGSLSGTTVVANSTAYSFTVVASDAENQDSPRTFSLNVVSGPDYIVKLYGSSSGSTFTDSSPYAHTVTNSDNQIVGDSTAKNGSNSIKIMGQSGSSYVRVNVYDRNINFYNDGWTLGYWFNIITSSDLDHNLVGLVTNSDFLQFGTKLNWRSNGSSINTQWQNASASFIGTGQGTFNIQDGSWYFLQVNHPPSSSTLNIKLYNSSLSTVADYSVDWFTWYGTNLEWAFDNDPIGALKINYQPSGSAYVRLDSIYLTKGTLIPPIPTSEPF